MTVDAGSRAGLEAMGFVGFVTTGQLHAERCGRLPNDRGVYAILRDVTTPPEFLECSTAAVYRGVDPSRPIDELTARWVPGAQLLYCGRAPGPGVRSRLKQRIKRYLRFGNGRVVGHWGGRLIWQLRDHAGLRVAWKTTGEADPAPVEAALLASFIERHGVPPFANLPASQEAEDELETGEDPAGV